MSGETGQPLKELTMKTLVHERSGDKSQRRKADKRPKIIEGAFLRLPVEVCVACQDLGTSHLDVYVALERTRQRVLGFDKEREGEWFTATHHMIGQRTACSAKTIQRCISEMEKAGIVEVERSQTRAKDGTIKNKPNNYRLPCVGYRSDKLTVREFEASDPNEQAVSPPNSTEETRNEGFTADNLSLNKKNRRKT